MIAVTDEAKQELKKILAENAQDPGQVLRLAANEEGQLGLVMDNFEEGDEVIEWEGARVLVVDGHLSSHLEGISLEVEDGPEGRELALKGEGCSCCCGEEHDESGCGGSCCGPEELN